MPKMSNRKVDTNMTEDLWEDFDKQVRRRRRIFNRNKYILELEEGDIDESDDDVEEPKTEEGQ